MTYMPVRRKNGPLHIASPTGKGYTTACGRKLAGADLTVPMPRIDLGRRHREAFWADVWSYEVVCRNCEKADPTP